MKKRGAGEEGAKKSEERDERSKVDRAKDI